MSKLLSLKLNDDVFRETEAVLREIRKPRNAYVNEAVNFYNQLWKRSLDILILSRLRAVRYILTEIPAH